MIKIIAIGGSPAAVLDFAKMFGVSNGAQSFYEYKGRQGTCRMKEFPPIQRFGNSCTSKLDGDEDQLKALVSKQPVVAAVSMTMNMFFYRLEMCLIKIFFCLN